jgi:hypothetical protein
MLLTEKISCVRASMPMVIAHGDAVQLHWKLLLGLGFAQKRTAQPVL